MVLAMIDVYHKEKFQAAFNKVSSHIAFALVVSKGKHFKKQ
jgi:hypothetical protein